MNNEPQNWSGLLIKQRLFVGSKSEGEYWILLADDGLWYRLTDSQSLVSESQLKSSEGKKITLLARLDFIRGHRRLVVMSNTLSDEGLSESEDSTTNTEGANDD